MNNKSKELIKLSKDIYKSFVHISWIFTSVGGHCSSGLVTLQLLPRPIMDQSPYIKQFALLFEACTTLDYRTGSVNPMLLSYALLCWIFVVATNTYAMDTRAHGIPVRDIYESIAFIVTIIHVPFLLKNRYDLAALVDVVTQPFYHFKLENYQSTSDIICKYVTWVNRFGFMYIFYNILFLPCFVMVFTPLLTLPFYNSDTPVQDWPLPVGKIPFHTDSYVVYAVAYVISASAISSAGMFNGYWHLTMVIASLHVKCRLGLLNNSLDCLEQRVDKCLPIDRGLPKSWRRNQSAVMCLAETAHQHVEIIKFVKLFNKCFRMTLVVLFQGATAIVAVLVLQIFNRNKYKTQELVIGLNFASACFIVLGIFNVCGQLVINESDKLHRTLYECEWLTKSTSFKTSLRIMMTMTSRPLCLTVGGLYPLSMKSYARTMRTVYSHINLLLSLQKTK